MSLTLIRNYHTDACCERVNTYETKGVFAVSGQTATLANTDADTYIRPMSASQITDDLVGMILYLDYDATNLNLVTNVTEIWSNGSQHAYKMLKKYIAFRFYEGGSVTFREAGIYDKTDWDILLRDMPNHPNFTGKTAPLAV